MGKFASGKNSFAISDRSGFRYRYRDMRKEWNGLLVGKDEFEPKQPQLGPFRTVSDPQALRDARPETNLAEERSIQYGFNPVGYRGDELGFTENNLVAKAFVGEVTVTTPASGGISVTGVSGTAASGSVTVVEPSVSVTGVSGTAASGSVTVTSNVYIVTVASGTNAYGTGNKFYIDGVVSPTLSLAEGSTFRFDQSDSSNSSHPLRFSSTPNGTHAGGSEYTTGVTTSGTAGQAGAYVQITVANSAPTLYYYCTNHSGMGGTANTP
tara:strand:+ start:6330 stop:7130 length:801 start_codon:yes stop_codon:yes gene_type:complete